MKTETGVMVMKDGKAWGVVEAAGSYSTYGWIDPEDTTIYNPIPVKSRLMSHGKGATIRGSYHTRELPYAGATDWRTCKSSAAYHCQDFN